MIERKKNLMVGSTGRLVKGHVLDVARAPLEAKLRDYDPQLYLKWEPDKLRGLGCWAIWRRPNEKSVKAVFDMGEYSIAVLDYIEHGHVHHVLDAPRLNYWVLEKLKQMDTWTNNGYKGANFNRDIEYAEQQYYEREEDRAEEALAYSAKQNKTAFNDLKEFAASGGNPHRLADVWNKA